MVGLAFRAGKVMSGSMACEKGLDRHRICLLMIQQGLSENSVKQFTGLCARSGAEWLIINASDDLGASIGRPGVMLVGITDIGFAQAIKNNYHGGSGIE